MTEHTCTPCRACFENQFVMSVRVSIKTSVDLMAAVILGADHPPLPEVEIPDEAILALLPWNREENA